MFSLFYEINNCIIITDSISQSSNFCVIVLDETTYYISAFAVDSNGTIINVQSNVITTSFFYAKYQKVEYIQSSGTQYINTGYVASNNTKAEFKISNWNINSSIQYLFGAYSTWGNNMFGLLGTTAWSGDTISGHLIYGSSEYSLSSGNIGNGGTHTGELSKNGFYVDGNLIKSVSGTFNGTVSITIFSGHNNNSIGQEKGSFKLYYFKIYNSGTLVRDFYPCYRKSDNVIGLLDTVNKQFYTNQGSGTFSKGSNVPR